MDKELKRVAQIKEKDIIHKSKKKPNTLCIWLF